jgi:hypothetical protein
MKTRQCILVVWIRCTAIWVEENITTPPAASKDSSAKGGEEEEEEEASFSDAVGGGGGGGRVAAGAGGDSGGRGVWRCSEDIAGGEINADAAASSLTCGEPDRSR